MNQEIILNYKFIILVAFFLLGIVAAAYQLRTKKEKSDIKKDEKEAIVRLQREHILNLYRLKYDDYYHKLKCEMYQSNDPHNIKVLLIEIVEAAEKRGHDMGIFNLIDLGVKEPFSYDNLKLKLITAEQFNQLLNS